MTFVGDLSWNEVERRIAQGVLAILPVGAGAKQHGFHMPMKTDAIQAEWLAGRLADALDALVWPVLTYGHYPAFTAYAGSVSLSAPLQEALVHEIVTALLGVGVSGVIVVNTGISTIGPIDAAIAQLKDPLSALHLKVYDGPDCGLVVKRARQTHGGHADELETSILLAIAPRVVTMDRAVIGTKLPPGSGPMQHVDPQGRNYSASGAIGDPTGATRGLGEDLLEGMLSDMMTDVKMWGRYRHRR